MIFEEKKVNFPKFAYISKTKRLIKIPRAESFGNAPQNISVKFHAYMLTNDGEKTLRRPKNTRKTQIEEKAKMIEIYQKWGKSPDISKVYQSVQPVTSQNVVEMCLSLLYGVRIQF